MPPPAIKKPDRIKEIEQLYSDLDGPQRKQQATRIGELLTEQKKEVGHKKFMKWVKNDLPFMTHRNANRYMRLYEYRDHPKVDGASNLTAALEEIRELTSKKPSEKPEAVVRLEMTKEQHAEWEKVMFRLSAQIGGKLPEFLLNLAKEKLGYEGPATDSSTDEADTLRIDRQPQSQATLSRSPFLRQFIQR